MTFTSQIWHRGFKADNPDTDVIENGTFANNFTVRADHRHGPQRAAQRPRQAPPPGLAAELRPAKLEDMSATRPQLYRQPTG